VLEIGNMLGDGGLADTQLGCRRRKGTAAGERRKSPQSRIELHNLSLYRHSHYVFFSFRLSF
jgi:hypothetical protein